MISIDNKFEIGEEVYIISSVPMKNKCSFCEGEGFIVHKEVKIKCPQCKGDKVVENSKYKVWEVMPMKYKISSLRASIGQDIVKIRYNLCGYRRAEENVFNNIEEAQAKCNELNKVIKEV